MAVTTELAEFCDVGIFEAQLTAMALRRSAEEKIELALWIETPEFNERAARLERHVAGGARPTLYDVMAELELPIDLAAAWMGRHHLPIEVAMGRDAA